MDTNFAIAKHLFAIAELSKLNGENKFKIAAFETAANNIVQSNIVINKTNITTMPGVGCSIAKVIEEFLDNGSSKRFEDLNAKYPAALLTFTKFSGVGVRKALKLWLDGFRTCEELTSAALAGKLDSSLTRAILAHQPSRVPYVEAKRLAAYVSSQLLNHCERVEVCGSLRRRAKDAKDIDIVCQTKSKDRLVRSFLMMGQPVTSGEARSSVVISRYEITMQVDVWLATPENWGAHLNHVTGSKEHNIMLRSLAKQRGLKVNEYGTFEQASGRRLGGENEEDLYKILDMKFVEPWKR